MIEVKEGAVFISDAHSNSNRKEFLEFLKKLDSGELKVTQLFLMGDMFDVLIGGVSYLEEFYHDEIELLNRLSKDIEIYYFEGNHDFCLEKLFPQINIISFKNQPVNALYHDKKLLLSHGDSFEGSLYRIFHTVLRSAFIVSLLNLIDKTVKNKLSKWYLKKTQNKKICKKIENFEQIIKQKILLNDIGLSEVDFVLEGHLHQGRGFECEEFSYFNFSSFACSGKYYQLKGDKITFQ